MELQRLTNLDLNLLVYLHVLLEERSVTGAAERLGRSQPALSTALKRLRALFDDELLLRVGNTYELTPLASRLVERTALALGDLDRVFATRDRFEPELSDREFVLATSDYGASVLGAALDEVVDATAPRVRLRFDQLTPDIVDNPEEGLRSVDAVIMPHGFLEDVPHLDLYRDEWVCIVSADNDRVGDDLTVEDLRALPWVITFHRPTAFVPPARQLKLLGVPLKADIVVQGFLPIPWFIRGTERIAFVQRRLAHRLADSSIRVLECPFDAAPLTESVWWHPVYERDPGHRWLRTTLQRAARALPSLESSVPTD